MGQKEVVDTFCFPLHNSWRECWKYENLLFHSLYVPLRSAAHLHMFKQCLPLCKGKNLLNHLLSFFNPSSVTQYSLTQSCNTCMLVKFGQLILHTKLISWSSTESEKENNQSINQPSEFTKIWLHNHLYTILISCGAILNIKLMTSFAESNLSSCTDFITLDPCLITRHQMSSSKEESKKGQCLS